MIAYIKGSVEFKGADKAIVECGGIGYSLNMPLSQINELPQIGTNVKVYTYMHVREDILDLYGFTSEDALSLFQMLITVSGVGPKAAMSILSAHQPATIKSAIAGGDHKLLSQAQGIGAKTAQRIVLELKDKIDKASVGIDDMPSVATESNAVNEAISALVSLGYTYNESKNALRGASANTTEELLKYGLKQLMK
ncbi:MAG: Holliday junction branch migration protein RuvA [Clostridia bacterium]|nr:Holliday junction branch migration protein RuvA [Clostridia bacterium]